MGKHNLRNGGQHTLHVPASPHHLGRVSAVVAALLIAGVTTIGTAAPSDASPVRLAATTCQVTR